MIRLKLKNFNQLSYAILHKIYLILIPENF